LLDDVFGVRTALGLDGFAEFGHSRFDLVARALALLAFVALVRVFLVRFGEIGGLDIRFDVVEIILDRVEVGLGLGLVDPGLDVVEAVVERLGGVLRFDGVGLGVFIVPIAFIGFTIFAGFATLVGLGVLTFFIGRTVLIGLATLVGFVVRLRPLAFVVLVALRIAFVRFGLFVRG